MNDSFGIDRGNFYKEIDLESIKDIDEDNKESND